MPDTAGSPQKIIAGTLCDNFGRLFEYQADAVIAALLDQGYAITREALCSRSGGCGD